MFGFNGFVWMTLLKRVVYYGFGLGNLFLGFRFGYMGSGPS